MTDPLTLVSTRRTPQSEQADPRQKLNAAGGYVFQVDDMARLHRFLTLGSSGSTYYASAKDLTTDNAKVVMELARTRPRAVVDAVVEVSVAGRAPKVNPALFALAVVIGACSDAARAGGLLTAQSNAAMKGKAQDSPGYTELEAAHDANLAVYGIAVDNVQYATAAIPKVVRTGSHMLTFTGYVEQFRGWGRAMRHGVGSWYADKDADQVAYQVAKYKSRDGWSQRDVLRLAHPDAPTIRHEAVYDWISGRENYATPTILDAMDEVHRNPDSVVDVLRSAPSMSWEMLPSETLTDPDVWKALIDNGLPMTALIRNLPRLTNLGVITPMGEYTQKIAAQLVDPDRLRKARVHPVNVLVALRTYAGGRSIRGASTWHPNPVIIDALDASFYASFGAVEPANKRTMLAVDVSGSMTTASLGDLPLSAREAAAAIAMVVAKTEPQHHIIGFTAREGQKALMSRARTTYWGEQRSAVTPLPISPRQRLDDVLRTVDNLPFYRTDCALPMLYALQEGIAVDTFVTLTDNETFFNDELHPHQALRLYREKTGIPARLVVVSMTATASTIVDPDDALSLDVAGFDSAVPNLLTAFSRGDV